MKEKIIGILLIMLMIATTFTVTVVADDNTAPHSLRFITTIGKYTNPAPLGTEAEVKIFAIDDEGNDIFAKIDWGDGTPLAWDGPYTPSEYHYIQHIYYELPPGGGEYYTAQLWVIDDPNGDGDPSDGLQSPESPTTDIYVEDVQPLGGATLDGPDEGSAGLPIYFDVFVNDDFGPRNIGVEFEINGVEQGPKGSYQSETQLSVARTLQNLSENILRVRGWVKLSFITICCTSIS